MCETSESNKINAARQDIPYINDAFTKETRSTIRSATFLVQFEVMSLILGSGGDSKKLSRFKSVGPNDIL